MVDQPILLLLGLPAAILLACAPERIDASSTGAATASIERIERELAPEERARFEEALRILVIEALSSGLQGSYGDPMATQKVDERLLASLSGKSVREIIAHADAIRADDGP
jgi:hypothetical protein